MKISFVTDDERTISAHFGRATSYLVVTIESGQVTGREKRLKPGHSQFANEPGQGGHAGGGHGAGPGAQARHGRMMDAIADCQILVSRGMGTGAYEGLKSRGIQPIQPILTDLHTIDDAVAAYLNGSLADHPERLH